MLPDTSRSQIQKRIQNGEILVNHQVVKVHHFLRTGDQIIILEKPKYEQPTIKESSPSLQQPRLLFEDEHYIIVDKPAGMLVHPTEKQETNTLFHWLIQHFPEIKQIGGETYRAGIIHRLDRDVSGVMAAARSYEGFLHLKQQFKERKVKKIYLALVYGQMPHNSGKIDIPIGRNKEGKFVAHPRWGKRKLQEKDKTAYTLYEVKKTYKNYSLLSVQILTGRTHQIRIHLSAVGHPIVGDREYGPKKNFFHTFFRKIKVIHSPRLMLHSTQLGFLHLDQTPREFISPLPHDMEAFLNTLS